MSTSPADRAEILFLREVLAEMEKKPPRLIRTNRESWMYAGLGLLIAVAAILLTSPFMHTRWFRILEPILCLLLGAMMIYMPGRAAWRGGMFFLRPFLDQEGIKERLRQLQG